MGLIKVYKPTNYQKADHEMQNNKSQTSNNIFLFLNNFYLKFLFIMTKNFSCYIDYLRFISDKIIQ